eukprot:647321-Alexandrium_andersonii.AAC.1
MSVFQAQTVLRRFVFSNAVGPAYIARSRIFSDGTLRSRGHTCVVFGGCALWMPGFDFRVRRPKMKVPPETS